MNINFSGNKIEFDKELNSLDNFTINFTRILDKLKIRYVLISGYVAILFGRSRSSENIDIIVEALDFTRFSELWREVHKNMECIITDSVKDAYNDYLTTGHSIRFAKKGTFMPNIEMKFPKSELDKWTVKERQEVVLNKYQMFISPMELQVSYKLFLGSEKDIEDAKHLYKIFKEYIDKKILYAFNKRLSVEKLFERYLI